jgi:hypothetical protein
VLLDARRIAWAHGVSPRPILIAGDPGDVIVIVAGDLRADLLVIGTTPRLPAGRLTAGFGPWVYTDSPGPVLPVWAARPTTPRPARDPILVT